MLAGDVPPHYDPSGFRADVGATEDRIRLRNCVLFVPPRIRA
ncbi:MAG: hypothetical protein OXG71_00945 [Rhodospirillales bacterium]|nr:hypothetical protein [Rhodospirillales bacterium]